MKRLWTIIAVADVARSFAWYQSLLGLPPSQPAHDHPTLASPAHAEPGNGLLLFFRVDDFDQALQRARRQVAALALAPALNPGTGTLEFAVRDPDGYYVMISAQDAI